MGCWPSAISPEEDDEEEPLQSGSSLTLSLDSTANTVLAPEPFAQPTMPGANELSSFPGHTQEPKDVSSPTPSSPHTAKVTQPTSDVAHYAGSQTEALLSAPNVALPHPNHSASQPSTPSTLHSATTKSQSIAPSAKAGLTFADKQRLVQAAIHGDAGERTKRPKEEEPTDVANKWLTESKSELKMVEDETEDLEDEVLRLEAELAELERDSESSYDESDDRASD